jgi:hypothetical protein
MCVLRSQTGAKSNPPSPAQMQEMYAAFHTWKETFKDHIVDMGAKLKPNGKILSESGLKDGPFIEAKEIIGGFMILSADNFEKAAEVAGGCPGVLSPGNTIEIREMATP